MCNMLGWHEPKLVYYVIENFEMDKGAWTIIQLLFLSSKSANMIAMTRVLRKIS